MARKKKKKPSVLIHLEYAGFLVLCKLLLWLPLRGGYALSKTLIRILYVLDPLHRNRTIRNLLHAGMAKNRAEAGRIAAASFDNAAMLLVEIVKMNQFYDVKKMIMSGPDAALDHLLPSRNSGKRQSIIVTAHLGNWEVAGTGFAEITGVPMFSLMRQFDNPLIGKLILEHRQSAIHTLIDKHAGIRPVLRALNDGCTATMLIDQHASGKEGVECIFFGHPARVHMSPALLHLKTGVPVIPELTVRMPGGDFRFDFRVGEPIYYTATGNKAEDIRRLTQRCITALEKMIREVPEQWLWFTRHWLDLDRRQSAVYRDWQPPVECTEEYEKEISRSFSAVSVDADGKLI